MPMRVPPMRVLSGVEGAHTHSRKLNLILILRYHIRQGLHVSIVRTQSTATQSTATQSTSTQSTATVLFLAKHFFVVL